jgi:hypothetical protein
MDRFEFAKIKKYLAPVVVVFVTLTCAVWFFIPGVDGGGNFARKDGPDPVPVAYPGMGNSSAKQLAQQLKVEAITRTNPKAAMMKGLLDAAKDKIKFYGKIIDQNNQPVTDATVEFTTGASYGFGNPKRYRTHSNALGVFVVKNVTGSSLSIESIKKEGYEIKVLEIGGRTFWPFVSASRTQIWTDYTQDNPFIYRAWKGEAIDLKTVKMMLAKFTVDEQPYTVNLLKYVDYVVKGKNDEGDLWVEFYRSDGASNKTKFDWHVIITVPDGGLIETDDVYMNHAPENGYRQSVTIDYPRDRDDWVRKIDNKKFYIKSRGGEIYGRVSIDIRPIWAKNYAAFNINFALNTNGSRNLMAKTD